MTISCINNNSSHRRDEKKTVRDLLEEHEKTSYLLTEGSSNKPVSIILLCDSPAPFDKKILDATPHIALHMEDDLLQKVNELHEENIKLRSLSLIDSLTGLFNNRFFWMQLEVEMARTKRTGDLCSLMMIDLDNFKLLNDTFGHLEGDRFLVEFGSILRDNSRSTDLIYRYGGDEFAVIMPATSVPDALRTGKRFQEILEDIPQKTDPAISLSIGVSEYPPVSSYNMNEFVNAADLAMYGAKKGGKNRICVDEKWEMTTRLYNEVNRDEKVALLMEYQ